jgi:hypothetical protein
MSSNDVWIEKYSKDHNRKYWKNKETGQVSWTPPTEGLLNFDDIYGTIG